MYTPRSSPWKSEPFCKPRGLAGARDSGRECLQCFGKIQWQSNISKLQFVIREGKSIIDFSPSLLEQWALSPKIMLLGCSITFCGRWGSVQNSNPNQVHYPIVTYSRAFLHTYVLASILIITPFDILPSTPLNLPELLKPPPPLPAYTTLHVGPTCHPKLRRAAARARLYMAAWMMCCWCSGPLSRLPVLKTSGRLEVGCSC